MRFILGDRKRTHTIKPNMTKHITISIPIWFNGLRIYLAFAFLVSNPVTISQECVQPE